MKRRTLGGIAINTLMLLAALCFIAPLYICVVMAFKTPQETAISTIALPTSLSFANFTEAMKRSDFGRSFINSIIVTGIGTLGVVSFSAMSGYVLSRKGKNVVYSAMGRLLFLGIMIPFQVIMIPVYRMYKSLDLMNTFLGVILLIIGSSLPYAIYLTIGFVKTVPMELEEAASIDGCGVWQRFWRIVFPLLKPITSTIGILHVLWIWNEFNISFIVLQKDAVRTLPIQQYHFFGQFSVNLNLGFASACLSMLPVLLFFMLVQRSLISGITAGAIKG